MLCLKTSLDNGRPSVFLPTGYLVKAAIFADPSDRQANSMCSDNNRPNLKPFVNMGLSVNRPAGVVGSKSLANNPISLNTDPHAPIKAFAGLSSAVMPPTFACFLAKVLKVTVGTATLPSVRRYITEIVLCYATRPVFADRPASKMPP